MHERTLRWLMLVTLFMAVAFGFMAGATHTPHALADGPTPTPTESTNSDPGGQGGGG